MEEGHHRGQELKVETAPGAIRLPKPQQSFANLLIPNDIS
jgi:hypothetical protein